MIDLSKLTFKEIEGEDGQRYAVATVTLNAKIPIGDSAPPDKVLKELAKQTFYRGLYGELVPPVIELVRFAQSRCAMPSDAAKVLGLSNNVNAILLGDPSLAAAPVEESRIIKLRR